jgi:hypothetical protein
MSFPSAPRKMTDALKWCEKIAEIVNQIMQGRTNNYGTVTLSANAATTTVTLPLGVISTESVIIFEPTTLNAAIEYFGGTMYRSATSVKATATTSTFTITHSNDASTDRVFLYCIIG